MIAGIVFLAIELRQNRIVLQLQAAQSYVNFSQELDFRLVDDPSLLSLISKSPEDMNDEELRRWDRWIFGSLRTWENGYYLYSKRALDEKLWIGQKNFMIDLLTRNPKIVNYYRMNSEFFSADFINYVDSIVREASE